MKVVVLGIQNVGKTAILHRYVTNDFNAYLVQTMIAGTLQKRVQNESETIVMDLWDTAGQEKFRSLTPQYIRGSHAAIIVTSVDNSGSAKDIPYFMDLIESAASEDITVCVALNKVDLPEEIHQVTKEIIQKKIEELPQKNRPAVFMVSAKVGTGINLLFDYIQAQTKSTTKSMSGSSTMVVLDEDSKNCC